MVIEPERHGCPLAQYALDVDNGAVENGESNNPRQTETRTVMIAGHVGFDLPERWFETDE